MLWYRFKLAANVSGINAGAVYV